jgi:subtilisin family serine protease
MLLQVASSTGGQARRIRVVNMSFSGYVDPSSSNYQATLDVFCAPFQDANNVGVAILAAAGNYGSSYRGGC